MRVREDIVRQSESRAPSTTRVVPPKPPARPGTPREPVLIEAAMPAGGTKRARRREPPAARTFRIPAAPPPRVLPSARRANLSFAGAVPSKSELERAIGTNDLVDDPYLVRALVAARPVCRLVLRDPASGRRGFATGFMVAPRLLLTNWHVFEEARAAIGAVAQFEYKLDIRGDEVVPVEFTLQPDLCFFSERALDFAIVAVDTASVDGGHRLEEFGYHRLIAEEHKIEEGEWITIIQHPGGAPRQYAIRENQLLEKQDPFLWYASDTAQGSSGAPAFNDQFQVVALHHSGKAKRDANGNYLLKDGTAVASLADVDDAAVDWEKNEGLRVSRLCARLGAADVRARLGEEWAAELDGAMRGGDIMSKTIGGRATEANQDGNGTTNGPTNGVPLAAPPGRAATPPGAAAGATPTVVLHIATASIQNINVAAPAAPAAPPAGRGEARPPAAGEPEKLVEPITDPDYSNRTGYDKDYLGTVVPMPEATVRSILSKLDDGSHVIPYQHFSVVVHKQRRLALFTASNVDGRKNSRQPGGSAFTRKQLTGLGENDREKWITDPRIPEQHQLPDKFYNEDRTAFDKGHIVRRDDVCWGSTFAVIQRANGDTFHTTNCSPQVKDFNQSGQDGIWGKLENEILKQAATETYCLFAGPVLEDDDPVFEGRDARGRVAIRIPRRYWKIVVARKGSKLQSFAFVLEQDLDRVRFDDGREFQVTEEWRPSLWRVTDLEQLLGNVRFPKVVKNADQFEAAGGHELLANEALAGLAKHAPKARGPRRQARA
jgi:endonuclease G